MKTAWLLAAGLLLLVLAGVVATPKAGHKATGLFEPLHPGEKVVLKDVGAGYQISVLPGLEAGHEVMEVGPDYLVLEDAAGMQTRIPVWAIKAITCLKYPR